MSQSTPTTAATSMATGATVLQTQGHIVQDPRLSLQLPDTRLQIISSSSRETLYRAEPEVRPQGNLDGLWNSTIRKQFCADLEPACNKIRRKFSGKPSYESLFMPDLLMTGVASSESREVLLSPCVWIACGSKACKKIIEKVVRNIDWLENWAIDGCRVRIEGAIFAASLYDDRALDLDLDLEAGIRLSADYSAYLHLQEDPKQIYWSSAMGLICCSTLTKNGVIVSQKLSRLGGVVNLRLISNGSEDPESGGLYGVTTAHNILDAWLEGVKGELALHNEDDDVSSESSDDSTLSINDYDEFNHQARSEAAVHYSQLDVQTLIESEFIWRNVTEQSSGVFADTSFVPDSNRRWDVRTGQLLIHDRHVLTGSDLPVFKIPEDMNAIKNICLLRGSDPAATPDLHVVKDSNTLIQAEMTNGGARIPLYIRGTRVETIRIKLSIPLGNDIHGILIAVFPGLKYHALVIPAADSKTAIQNIGSALISMPPTQGSPPTNIITADASPAHSVSMSVSISHESLPDRARKWPHKFFYNAEPLDRIVAYSLDISEIRRIDLHRTPLSRAAERGLGFSTRRLLGTGLVDVDSQDEYGRTALSWAAMNGHTHVVEMLLEKGGANVNKKDGIGRTALIWAAYNGHYDTMLRLIRRRADIEAIDGFGRTALFWASGNGHKSVVAYLAPRAAVNRKDTGGWTPLSWAAQSGHESVVRLLLESGANANNRGRGDWTPLFWAVRFGRVAIIRLLLEVGADVNSEAKPMCWTPLSLASRYGNDAVRTLLEQCACA